MVVLQESGSPIQAPAALLDPLDYRQTATCLKMLPKRYINLHQWLGPVCPKELKAQLVSVHNCNPHPQQRNPIKRVPATLLTLTLHHAPKCFNNVKIITVQGILVLFGLVLI